MKPMSLQVFDESLITDSFFIAGLEHIAIENEVPIRLGYHRILLVEGGSGKICIDEHSFQITGFQLFLIAKGQIVNFISLSNVSGFTLSFGDCFWEKAPSSASNCKAVLFNNAQANQRLGMDRLEWNDLFVLFTALSDEYRKDSYINQLDALAAYLKIIMIKIANLRLTEETVTDSKDYVLYRTFMELLSEHFRQHHKVGTYSEMLFITARRLSDLCKRCSEKTAKELINGQLIAEAKRSLQFSSAPVKQIAYQLNFNSAEQFSHFFKRNTKLSPADYRDMFLNIGTST